MARQYFAYTRVSTAKQGEHGVSLTEQRDAIERYSARFGLAVSQWFEERETAAKRGRTVFNLMLAQLRNREADGIVIHKIDRSARNLKDWADLGELIDSGVEVHFANESLDLNTRGGRLSADIQAVVASDYIRNLREETRKGFYGRLKQGIYPMAAPIGYSDMGGGKPKEPDPQMAPLIATAFELYDSGNFSLPRLKVEMHHRGLRNHVGGQVSLNGLSTVLNNAFYMGVIHIRKTSETFLGVHTPIISKRLFDRVQLRLEGKTVLRIARHDFAFRKLMRCALCGYNTMAEHQKGHVYYRCHTPACKTKTIREEVVHEAVRMALRPLTLGPEEVDYANGWLALARTDTQSEKTRQQEACRLQLDQLKDRRKRLTDAYLDQLLDRKTYEERNDDLIREEAGLRQRVGAIEAGSSDPLTLVSKFLELVKTAPLLYENAVVPERRDLVKKLTSNLTVERRNVAVTLTNGAQLVANRQKTPSGSPRRSIPRTWDTLLRSLVTLFEKSDRAEL